MSVIGVSKRAEKAMEQSIGTWFQRMPLAGTSKPKNEVVDISSGDPTSRPHQFNNVVSQRVKELLEDPQTYFYSSKMNDSSKDFVAKLHSGPGFTFSKEDIYFTQGGEFALTYAMRLLCSKGDNFIVPNPGYWHLGLTGPLYDVEVRTYGFVGEWEINFEELESRIDSNTKFILIVSPGNPNCITYTKEDFDKFTKIAQKHNLVLVSDEIYYGMTFDLSQPHLSPAHSASDVPVIIMCGLAKMCSVPGFSVEWLAVKDPAGKIDRLRGALHGLTSSFGNGYCFLLNVLPELFKVQKEFLTMKMKYIKERYEDLANIMKEIPQLKLMPTTASMFASIVILTDHFHEDLSDDHKFCSQLFKEEGLKLGRGTFNGQTNLLRVSLILTEEEYKVGLPKLSSFVKRHALP